MFIFIRLLLAHFLGDFPLQFNAIYQLKHNGLRGIIPHALIILACCLTLCWPYLNQPIMWCFIIFIAATHLLQDSIKLNYSTIKFGFWAYLLDQLFHYAIIALVFFTNLSKLAPPKNQSSFPVQLYCNDKLVMYFITLIFATYNGYYLIRTFKSTFLNIAERSGNFKKWYGMAERGAIVSLVFIGGVNILFIPAVMFFRPLIFKLSKNQTELHRDFISSMEMLLSWTIALIAGYILYLFHPGYPIY